jgi:hypothetical protein
MPIDLRALQTKISDAIGQQIRGNIAPVMAVVSELSEHKNLNRFIAHLLADSLWLQRVAGHSYYHANDFAKIVLLANQDRDWKLRLHLWRPQSGHTSEKPEDIHSHRWDFSTALISGEYLTTEFRPGSGLEYYRYEYRPPGSGESFTMSPRGQAELTPVLQARLPAGTVYHISHDVLHRVSCTSHQMTATLMIQGPALSNSTNVYSTFPIVSNVKSEIALERIGIPALITELDQFRACL